VRTLPPPVESRRRDVDGRSIRSTAVSHMRSALRDRNAESSRVALELVARRVGVELRAIWIGATTALGWLVGRLVPQGSTRRRVWLPGSLGALASGLILLGASQATSPYAFKQLPYAWYFGLSAKPPGPPSFIAVFAVLAGMMLLLFAWFWLLQIRLRSQTVSWKQIAGIFTAWTLPMLVVAPIFSRDVYTYAAQGEMVSHHISPYVYGPGVMGTGTAFTTLADPIWWQSASPYGPLFLRIDGSIVSVTGHSVLMSVVLLRLLALVGVVLAAIGVGLIARHFRRDPMLAVVLVALNPLVLLHLVGGAHNDALMVGLLAIGIALALYRHPILGVVVCACAASVKAPAALGVVFIGWSCLGERADGRSRRFVGVGIAGAIGLAVMAALAQMTGLGWGWIKGLSNPGVAHTWLDVPTGLGMFFGKVLFFIGLHGMTTDVISLTRTAGLLVAASIVLYLLTHCERVGLVRALGLSLLVVAILGPAVQPWYLTWGLIVLAPVASSRTLIAIVVGSSFSSFLGVPIGAVLIEQLQGFDVWLRIGVIFLAALLLVAAVRELRRLGTGPSMGIEPGLGRRASNSVDALPIQPQTVRL
jgi:alpha-1,6-mannosyltransferase